jgi:hypothetical protein
MDTLTIHVRGRLRRNTTRSPRYLSSRPAKGLGIPEALDRALHKELRKIERHAINLYRRVRADVKAANPEATPKQLKGYFQAAMSCIGELSFEQYLDNERRLAGVWGFTRLDPPENIYGMPLEISYPLHFFVNDVSLCGSYFLDNPEDELNTQGDSIFDALLCYDCEQGEEWLL